MYCRLKHFYKLKNSPRNKLGLNNSLIVIKGSLPLHALGSRTHWYFTTHQLS